MNKTPNGIGGTKNDGFGNHDAFKRDEPRPAEAPKMTLEPPRMATTPMSPPQHSIDGASVAQQAKHAVEKVVGHGKEELEHQLKSQKDDAASRVASVATALRETGKNMTGDTNALQGYTNQAADQVERLSTYVRSRTIGDLISDVEGFARREPAIFVGGAFALGLIAARFLKSSGHRPDPGPQGSEA